MYVESRHLIKLNLKAYGENELANRIDGLDDEHLNQIGYLAAKHMGEKGYVAKDIVLGAIEFFEGEIRNPRRLRRDLSVYQEKDMDPEENLIARSRKGRKSLN